MLSGFIPVEYRTNQTTNQTITMTQDNQIQIQIHADEPVTGEIGMIEPIAEVWTEQEYDLVTRSDEGNSDDEWNTLMNQIALTMRNEAHTVQDSVLEDDSDPTFDGDTGIDSLMDDGTEGMECEDGGDYGIRSLFDDRDESLIGLDG